MEKKELLKIIKNFFTNRIFIVSVTIVVMFSVLIFRLFFLQIVNGETYKKEIKASKFANYKISAPRGQIYDKFGRPLAINTVSYSVKIDGNIAVPDTNAMLLDLISALNKNNEVIIDELPISKGLPKVFLFNDSKSREENWKKEMGIEDMRLSADECYRYLCETLFKVPDDLDDTTKRNLVALRHLLYMNRFNYQPVTVAMDVSESTIAIITEENDKYPGAQIDVEPIRYYTEGELFAHILGYIRYINEEELEQFKEYEYDQNDLIGKLGIEKAMELYLRGTDGETIVEIDSRGRIISSEEVVPAIPGDKVYLTIDVEFQKKVTEIFENTLRDVIVSKLNNDYTSKDLFVSIVKSNNISIENIMSSTSETNNQYYVKGLIQQKIDEYNNSKKNDEDKIIEFNPDNNNHLSTARNFLIDLVSSDNVSSKQILLIAHEQKKLILNEENLQRINSGSISPMQLVIKCLESGELTPHDTGLDPSTGGVAVVDIKTGAVLSLVTYPSYDNNYYPNDYEYFKKIMNDPATPLINRPLMTGKAPGSTFKMVTAIAALEEGSINPNTKIYDYGIFTKAGIPSPKCMIYNSGGSHGSINISKAIEVSCNYFFYETSYNLGTDVTGVKSDNIVILNNYMKYFGLNDYTGIEIEENKPIIASPENKEAIVKAQNPDAESHDLRWTDGDTIRAAIGQDKSSFTPANMAKYIAALANGGKRYKMHIVNKVEDYFGETITKNEPVLEYDLKIKPENLEAVFQGMLGVTSGPNGTSRRLFENFEIRVAGKTGTAEETTQRPSHTWFVGFAPYDDPQIAIAVLIPYGEHSSSPAAVVSREIIAEYMGINIETFDKPLENILSR